MKPGACDTCAHASPWVTENGHATGGFVCAHALPGHYQSAALGCAFSPSRYQARPPAPASSA